MEMFCAYQRVLPSALEQTSHDFTQMIHSVFKQKKPAGPKDKKGGDGEGTLLNEEGACVATADLVQLQCHCLKFLMGFPSSRFRWFKEVSTDRQQKEGDG